MIDPTNITNYNALDWQLEDIICFWVLAAGKNGVTAAKCLHNLLQTNAGLGSSPFSVIRNIYNLPNEMKKHGIGCYNHKAKTFKLLVNSGINLRTCSLDELESIWGIGMKTSRGFILSTRPNVKLACLDRHVLSYMRDKGHVDIPKSTPASSKKYQQIEALFLIHVEQSGMSASELDLKIWNEYRVKAIS